jgi:chromosomal replication initiator protein
VNSPIAAIKAAVAEEFGITVAELVGRSREAKYAHPRAIAMQLALELTKASFQAIPREFDCRHHSTIHSAIGRSHNLIDSFPEYRDRREAVKRVLMSPPTP